jgi:DNA-binding response OmpR family regulator
MDCVVVRPKILFAEDDEILVDMYTRAFKDRNLEVDTARDGEEALYKLDSQCYDILLLDMMMPIKSGPDVLREMPASQSARAKVIILSNLMPNDVPLEVRQRADRYVVKADTTPSDLVLTINEVSVQ